jgi:hypothetical protein
MYPENTTLPHRTENLLHQTFHRLTAIEYIGHYTSGGALWKWQCTCGETPTLPASAVKSGNTKSCGCFQSETQASRATTHGMTGTPEHQAWKDLMARCFTVTHKMYKHYGERGITVCVGLRVFENFFVLVGLRPSPKLSIDRINNNGNYSCGKCEQCVAEGWVMNLRWATWKQQRRNTRQNRLIEMSGETLCLAEWANRYGVNSSTLRGRLERGLSLADAIMKAPNARSNNRLLTFDGQTMCLSDWARLLGIPYSRISDRLDRLGWSVDRALTAPPIEPKLRPRELGRFLDNP